VVGNTCHISGQLATYDDGYHPGTVLEEATRAFELLFRIATQAGFERADIVYVDLAFVDLHRDVAEVNALYGKLFDEPPARTIYQAAALPYGAKIKVQAIAMRD
jgi:2-iminobutanoate/2-iminopropanoate deaminase